ncbi:MAG: polymerase sigma factor, sigma-70 family [Planctomycetaceae bacterium]|nr:polymerase sigma factor, sigma-70 family [Planctomycetaceae bacterium]
MFRSILVVVFAVLPFPASSSAADEYLVHLETFGYEKVEVVENESPKSAAMNSLQIVARPGVPFYGRTGNRGNFIKVKGEMKPDTNGTWKVDVHYTERKDDLDSSVVSAEGFRVMGLFSRTAETTVNVKLGQSVQISSLSQNRIRIQNGKEVNSQSKVEVRLRVTEFRSDEMTPEEAEVFDIERLRNVSWSAVKLVEDGKTADENLVKQIVFRFEADRLFLAGPESSFGARRFEFQLDTVSSPGAMRLTALDGRWQGQSVTALYDLTSGDLHICIPEFGTKDRPASLEAPSGSKLKFIILDKD